MSNIFQVLKSVLAAFIGIQSASGYCRDATAKRHPVIYILVGLATAACLLGFIFMLTTWITTP